MRGMYANPILFYIQPSLILDYSNLTNTISTAASSVDVYFKVSTESGKFVKKDYKGIISSTND